MRCQNVQKFPLEDMNIWVLNPRPPKVGYCNLLWFFPNNFLGQPKVAKRVYFIYTNPITHLFTKVNRNLRVPYGYWELSKLSVGEGWWNSMILILPIIKIFDKKYAYNLVCRLELAFLYLFCQTFCENRMFLRFLAEKSIFVYSLCIFAICSQFWGRVYIMTP